MPEPRIRTLIVTGMTDLGSARVHAGETGPS